MILGFRPPKDPMAFRAHAWALGGPMDPGGQGEGLKGVARGMGYRLPFCARYLDPYLASPEPARAARLGAELVNAHAGSIPWTDYPSSGLSPAHEALREAERRLREEALERALEAFLRLSRLAASVGVALVLENLPAPQGLPRGPEEVAPFRDPGGSAVGLPPRLGGEWLEVREELASTGLVPEAMGGDAG